MAEIRMTSEAASSMGLPFFPYQGSNMKVVERKLIDKSRWADNYSLIVEFPDGKFYQTFYQRGSTECQEVDPWYDESEVVFTEVKKVPKVVEVWEEVKE